MNITTTMINELIQFNKNSIKYIYKTNYVDTMIKHLKRKFPIISNPSIKSTDYNDATEEFINSHFIKRSYINNDIINPLNDTMKDIIKNKIHIIEEKDKTNPPQRTPDWYRKRYNLLSASNIYKALGTQKQKNSLIYEKCMPLNIDKHRGVNINSPFHWGQKYEPVAQMYYEYNYNAVVNEYGCIPHDSIEFLGASPDGIIVNEDCDRYGRLLEIKCVVSRIINGIPKPEYWVQMQLQMECNDLDECDFLECNFEEYDIFDDYINDGDFQKTETGLQKGVIMYFDLSGIPHYEYCPFNASKEEFDIWEEEMMKKNNDKCFVRYIGWRLENVSCVTVPRNRQWFNEVLPEFQELWNTILDERISGYEHRKPSRRSPKPTISNTDTDTKKISPLMKPIDKASVQNQLIKSSLFESLLQSNDVDAKNLIDIDNQTKVIYGLQTETTIQPSKQPTIFDMIKKNIDTTESIDEPEPFMKEVADCKIEDFNIETVKNTLSTPNTDDITNDIKKITIVESQNTDISLNYETSTNKKGQTVFDFSDI